MEEARRAGPDERRGWEHIHAAHRGPAESDRMAPFDEIKSLVETYWRTLAVADEAYKALPPSKQQNVRAPGTPPLS